MPLKKVCMSASFDADGLLFYGHRQEIIEEITCCTSEGSQARFDYNDRYAEKVWMEYWAFIYSLTSHHSFQTSTVINSSG